MTKKKLPDRTTTLSGSFRSNAGVAVIRAKDGDFKVLDWSGRELPMQDVVVERSYPRAGKPDKVLSRMRLKEKPNGHSFLYGAAATKQFDAFFAIDTNWRVVGSKTLAVSCLTIHHWIDPIERCNVSGYPGAFLEMHDFDRNFHPDLIALALFVQALEQQSFFPFTERVAFILDSNLSTLEEIEKRTTRLPDGSLFPEWAGLLYASDVSADTLLNVLLKTSDAQANELLSAIEEGRATNSEPLLTNISACAAYRYWPGHWGQERERKVSRSTGGIAMKPRRRNALATPFEFVPPFLSAHWNRFVRPGYANDGSLYWVPTPPRGEPHDAAAVEPDAVR